MTTLELSQRLAIKRATCYHLVNTLEHEGLLRRDGDRRVVLGARIAELYDAFAAMLTPDPRLLALLDDLARRTGETTYLGLWEGDDVVTVAVREGNGGVRVRGPYLGYRDHAYARAAGRALLAFRDDAFIDSYLAREKIVPLTQRTTTDPQRLRTLLEGVRANGYAIDIEEFMIGVCCVAAPLLGADGRPLAALSVSMPKARFEVDGQAILRTLRDVAAGCFAGADGPGGRRGNAREPA